MNTRILILTAGAAAIVAAGVFFMAGDGQAAGLRIPYENAEAVAAGEGLYADYCAACHGAALEGEPDWQERGADGLLPAPPHDASGHTWHHADPLLFAITKHGSEAVVGGGYQSNMAGFGEVLSDGEILAVLAYIKSTWPDRVIAIHNRINDEAGG